MTDLPLWVKALASCLWLALCAACGVTVTETIYDRYRRQP